MTGHVQTQLGETATNQNWPLVWTLKGSDNAAAAAAAAAAL